MYDMQPVWWWPWGYSARDALVQDGREALGLGLVLALVGQVCKLVAVQAALSQAVVAW